MGKKKRTKTNNNQNNNNNDNRNANAQNQNSEALGKSVYQHSGTGSSNTAPNFMLTMLMNASANIDQESILDFPLLESLNQVDYSGDPFPHCVVRNFLNPSYLDLLQKCLISHADQALDSRNSNKIVFKHKHNDLFNFIQSEDLSQCNDPIIKSLRKALQSKRFRDFLSKLFGGVELNSKVSMFAAIYGKNHRLLCHDDMTFDRKIAFILYLSPIDQKIKDGGTLDFFDSENGIAHDQIIKSFLPINNQFICFEVSNSSFHQVAEVVSKDKRRLSISGQFHVSKTSKTITNNNNSNTKNSTTLLNIALNRNNALPIPTSEHISKKDLDKKQSNLDLNAKNHTKSNNNDIDVSKANNSMPKSQNTSINILEQSQSSSSSNVSRISSSTYSVDFLRIYSAISLPFSGRIIEQINPIYLHVDFCEKIRKQFSEEGSIQLKNLLLPNVYEELICQFHKIKKQESVGPPNRNRFMFVRPQFLPLIFQQLRSLLISCEFVYLLRQLTNLDLKSHYDIVRLFRPGDYTLTIDRSANNIGTGKNAAGNTSQQSDSQTEANEEYHRLELNFCLIFGDDENQTWDVSKGGTMHFMDDDEHLLQVQPSHNSLSLVYCDDPDIRQFIEYISLDSNKLRCDFDVSFIVDAKNGAMSQEQEDEVCDYGDNSSDQSDSHSEDESDKNQNEKSVLEKRGNSKTMKNANNK